MMAERHLLDDPVSLKIILLAWRCSIRSSLSRRDRRTPKNTEGFKQPSRFGDMKCRNQCSFSSAHQLGKTMTPIGNSGLCWVRGGDGWRRQHSHTATCPPWLFGCLVVLVICLSSTTPQANKTKTSSASASDHLQHTFTCHHLAPFSPRHRDSLCAQLTS